MSHRWGCHSGLLAKSSIKHFGMVAYVELSRIDEKPLRSTEKGLTADCRDAIISNRIV